MPFRLNILLLEMSVALAGLLIVEKLSKVVPERLYCPITVDVGSRVWEELVRDFYDSLSIAAI